MRVKQSLTKFFIVFLIVGLGLAAQFAEASGLNGKTTITFEGENGETPIRDPENPTKIVDPGNSPKTNGKLRFDFVPQFDFWNAAVKSDNQNEIYYGNAQHFHGDTTPRGNFIQISDYRDTAEGWVLQVRQEKQFYNEHAKNKELKGATLSLANSWVSSTRDLSEAPSVPKNGIILDNIGQTYNLAEAKKGTGGGTWQVVFGMSEDYAGTQSSLSPRKGNDGESLSHGTFENKPVYQNKALSLQIPGATKIDPVPYQTMITWTLSELP